MAKDPWEIAYSDGTAETLDTFSLDWSFMPGEEVGDWAEPPYQWFGLLLDLKDSYYPDDPDVGLPDDCGHAILHFNNDKRMIDYIKFRTEERDECLELWKVLLDSYAEEEQNQRISA